MGRLSLPAFPPPSERKRHTETMALLVLIKITLIHPARLLSGPAVSVSVCGRQVSGEWLSWPTAPCWHGWLMEAMGLISGREAPLSWVHCSSFGTTRWKVIQTPCACLSVGVFSLLTSRGFECEFGPHVRGLLSVGLYLQLHFAAVIWHARLLLWYHAELCNNKTAHHHHHPRSSPVGACRVALVPNEIASQKGKGKKNDSLN